ncbi:hypothetical protein KCU62_g7193, partial [Aureobasidium sp. EXF-3399]
MSPSMAASPDSPASLASSDSDSDWETDDSEPRPSAPRNSNGRGNTTIRRRRQIREVLSPAFDMSPFGDGALGDFMYGLEANGFGSMLRDAGIPHMGSEYGDFGTFDDSDSSDSEDSDSDDSDESSDSDDEDDPGDSDDSDSEDDDSSSSSSGDSSDDSDSQQRKKRRVEDARADDSSSDDSSEEEAEDWAVWERKIKAEHQARAAAAATKTSSNGPSKQPTSAQPPVEAQKTQDEINASSSTAQGNFQDNDSNSAQPPDKIQQREDDPDTASPTVEEKSTEARNRGSDLYRKRLFDEATKAYFEALSLTPNDPAPLSNLSAVQFELGGYPGSIKYAEKALQLLNNEADSNPKKQKLFSRLARAQALQLQNAAPLVSKFESSDTIRNSAIQAGVTWMGDEIKLSLRPSPEPENSAKPTDATYPAFKATIASKRTTAESSASRTQKPSPSSIPAHISNDIDRKLIKEFQITVSLLASIVTTNAKEPGLSKSERRDRREYVRVVNELRRRADPTFKPPMPSEFRTWPLLELLCEVRGAEFIAVHGNLLPKNLYCQRHICRLVAGTVLSLDTPSKKSLEYMKDFDEHIRARRILYNSTTAPEAPVSEKEALSPASMPDHISNDVDRKLVREFQTTLSRFADAAAKDANDEHPYMPKSIRKARREYVRVVDELRQRTDPSFAPFKPTKFEKLSDGDLINEVREAEMMVIMAPLLPKNKQCQLHICKLVSGEMPSLEVPSSESLNFVEEFDKHIETRKRYDAWKEKEVKEPKSEGQMNPDCAPQ